MNMISNTITLTKEVKGECYECIATIRVKEEKSYLTTVLKLGLNNKVIDESSIINELLPGEHPKMATNMIRRYKQLGFLDEYGYLTELGLQAANGNVYLPETGKYLIIVSSDPLIQNRFIELKSLDNKNSIDEYSGKAGNSGKNKIKIPETLVESIGKRSLVWFNDKIEEVQIDEISDFVIKMESEQKCFAELALSQDRVLLKLSRNNSEIKISPPGGINLYDVWEYIVDLKKLNWNGGPLQKGTSLMYYEDIRNKEKDIKSFTTTIPSLELFLEDFGVFKTEPIEIKIQPESSEDATKWALDLISFEIVDYIHEEAFDHIVLNVKNKFILHQPRLPKLADFIEYLLQKSKKEDKGYPAEYWYLRAPLDLVLEED